MNSRQGLVKGEGIALGAWFLALAAWYLTDYLMNALNLTLNCVQLGRISRMGSATWFSFVGDHIGWSHVLPYWFSLTLPILVVLCLAVTRSRLTWQTALRIGFGIVAAQLIVGIVKNFGHLSEPRTLLWYAERLSVLPGPLIAGLCTAIDLFSDPKEA